MHNFFRAFLYGKDYRIYSAVKNLAGCIWNVCGCDKHSCSGSKDLVLCLRHTQHTRCQVQLTA